MDVFVLSEAELVEDAEAGVFQGDQAAAERGAGRRGLVEGDMCEAGLGEQQSCGGTGQRSADDSDPRSGG
ncbi:hypothetical protein GKC29_14840 [Micromonospora sp. WMMC415]|uniref:hypothetical protein n=1 Tax=Micromonospora sp. WMMC415 TaxID=2675222 RepID=UPI0012B4EC80|nr:hypothetical protein [Micromonospora sp. WMMC415]QGN47994.1 hypothetical protein GKC29_14840 [Micromonospora sp. WMMC415]